MELYVPKLQDLWFSQMMLSDPETMSYNDPWGGCIDFPEEKWQAWYDRWIGREPERFYAYIQVNDAWIGDVNFHYTPEKDWWDMGIVIYAPYRGKGYSFPALQLFADRAFRVCGITRLHNDFEDTRSAALHIHQKLGFRDLGLENGFRQLILTKEDYFLKSGHLSPL